MKYTVYLTAKADVKAAITVDAFNAEEARMMALTQAKSGDAVWSYDGVDDTSIRIADRFPQGS